MAKTADELLNDLAARDLVPADTVASLRRQVAKSAQPVTAAAIAKLLIDKGHLTAAQAQRLLGVPQPAPAAAKTTPPAKPSPFKPPPADADLMPLEELVPLEDAGLMPLEAAPLPAAAASVKTAGAAKSAAQAPASTGPAPLDSLLPLDEPAELEPLDSGAAADSLADANLTGPLTAAPAAQAAAGPAKKKGSLGLVLIVLAVVVLLGATAGGAYFFIPRSTGDAELELAETDYQAKQYDAAIAKYDAVLAKYPHNPRASLARVHRAAAQVLAARAASPRDWSPALVAAQESLPPIGGEADLPQAHAELSPLLTQMAIGLAAEAADANSPDEAVAKLAAAREALALADDGRFVPGAQRDWQRLAAAAESLALVAHEGELTKTRAAAAAAIQQAIDGGDVAAALAERGKLRMSHPPLLADPQVRDLAGPLAQAAAAKVQSAEYTAKAETTEPRPAIVASVLFASPIKSSSGMAGPPALVSAGGSVWALDSGSGKLLWRRPVGAGSTARPVPVSASPDSDVLLVDSLLNELLCVAAASGQLRWRHPLPGPAAGPPLVVGTQVFVTTRAGQVLAIDAGTGSGQAAANIPQPAACAAAADASGKHLYQLADDALVYVLSPADLKCVGAAYVGHEPASVVAGPAVLAGRLVVAENQPAAGAVLHVLPLDAAGLPQDHAPGSELAGQVASSLLVDGGRLVVLTDRGRVLALESASDADEGLKQIATADAGAAEVIRYGLVQNDQVFVAGEGLRLLAPPAGGTLREQWSAAIGVCLGPPLVVGSAIVIASRQPDQPGVLITAVQTADGQAAWQTRLAEPLVAVLPSGNDGQAAVAVSASGRTTRVNVADLEGDVVQEVSPPAADAPPPQPIVGTVALGGGSHALVPAGHTAGLFVLDSEAAAPRPLALPGLLAGMPIAWQGGIVVPCTSGAIVWLDPASGEFKADPLQLPLAPGQRLENCRLAAAGDKQQELLVDNGRGAVLRVGLATDPAPHLVALPTPEAVGENSQLAPAAAQATPALDLHQPLAGPPLIAGQFALVPAADGSVLKVSLAALEAVKP